MKIYLDDNLIENALPPTPAGTCRYCGCTDERACVRTTRGNTIIQTCAWVDVQHTVCSSGECVKHWCYEMCEKFGADTV